MKVTLTERDAIAITAVDSSILQENVPLLRTNLSKLVQENHRWIIIDLSKANYLSSMGVAVIVDIKLKANRINGDLKLACVNQLIRNLLDITNVSRRIDIYPTVDDAVAAIKQTIAKQVKEA
jgi:anti-sigma B factor antagonist